MKELAYCSSVIGILPGILSLILVKRHSIELSVLKLYFIISALTEITTSLLAYYKMNNNVIADSFYLAEGILIGLYFYNLLHKQHRSLFVIAGILYSLLALYTSLVSPGMEAYNSTLRTVESILMQILSGIGLIHITIRHSTHLVKNPHFWFTSALFIYFTVNITLFYSSYFLIKNSRSELLQIWTIHSIINIMANILFCIGLIRIKTRHARI